MFGLVILFSSLSGGAGAAAAAAAPTSKPHRSGFYTHFTLPGEEADAVGYDVGARRRGRRFLIDFALTRLVHPYKLDDHEWSHREARKTGRFGLGVHWADKAGNRHQLAVRADRMSWLDLASDARSLAWDHHMARSFGVTGAYGWASPDARRVRTAVELGGGIRRTLGLDSVWGGTLVEWVPLRTGPTHTSNGEERILDLSLGSPEPRRPRLNTGRHRLHRAVGATCMAGAQMDVALWPGVVEGRLHGTLAMDQIDGRTWSWGTDETSGQTRWTTLTGRTRVAVRLVAGERLAVPSVFVDVNASGVVNASTQVVVAPVVGLGLTGGVF
ncbi:MAG: hypothetical protein CL927_05645 [Deltaproteobacteria bacterium]|nr:hypothetical protein [Deltaproteobacteria bacterium]